MADSECLPTRLNPLAEMACFPQAAESRDPRAVAALSAAWAPAYDETMLDWADLAPAKVGWPWTDVEVILAIPR